MKVEPNDGLYARAWECDYESPIFDAKDDNAFPGNSTETEVRSGMPTDGTWNTPGNSRERSPEIIPQTGDLFVLTDTYPYMEPEEELSSEQPNHSPISCRNSKYNLRHNPQPNCDEDFK